MTNRRNGRLNHENICPSLLRNRPILFRFLWDGRDCHYNPRLFHLLNSLRNQLLSNWGNIHLLDQMGARILVRFSDLLQDARGILIPSLNPL